MEAFNDMLNNDAPTLIILQQAESYYDFIYTNFYVFSETIQNLIKCLSNIAFSKTITYD